MLLAIFYDYEFGNESRSECIGVMRVDTWSLCEARESVFGSNNGF